MVASNRYATNFIDVHTTLVSPIPASCARSPSIQMSFSRTSSGTTATTAACSRGGTLYTDNEIVLNSKRVFDICTRAGVTVHNSCEYEPWQNGISERGRRSLLDSMRPMHEREG